MKNMLLEWLLEVAPLGPFLDGFGAAYYFTGRLRGGKVSPCGVERSRNVLTVKKEQEDMATDKESFNRTR